MSAAIADPHRGNAPLVVISGTGTEIGKTVVSTALVSAWTKRGARVAGVKPIESGYATGRDGDADMLAKVSTFHVTHSPTPYRFRAPLSPHLAARLEGRTISPEVISHWLEPIRRDADAIVLELAGGLFSPLHESITNAELVANLQPSKLLLVAPDRLGVLHDLVACARAADAQGIRLDGIILSAPPLPDSASGTNEAELARVLPLVPVLGNFPRAPRTELVKRAGAILTRLEL